MVKADLEKYKKQANELCEATVTTVVSDMDIAKVIEALDAEINEFNAEVDAALSVSNALTVIEFSY